MADGQNKELPFGPIPAFPYFLLVRAPFISLLAALFVSVLSKLQAKVEINVGTGLMVVSQIAKCAVLLSGFLQLCAVPVALYCLIYSNLGKSWQHWLAIFCGASHFSLVAYVVFSNVTTY
jgi:hypothetical protein